WRFLEREPDLKNYHRMNWHQPRRWSPRKLLWTSLSHSPSPSTLWRRTPQPTKKRRMVKTRRKLLSRMVRNLPRGVLLLLLLVPRKIRLTKAPWFPKGRQPKEQDQL